MYEVDFINIGQLDEIEIKLRELLEKGPVRISAVHPARRRTLPQNAALHVWAEQIAKKMNDAGITQRELIGKFIDGFELPVTCYMIKDIFREVGRAMFEKESTADLLTTEMQEVYRVVDQRFGEVCSVRAEWPSRFGGGDVPEE